MVEDWIQGSGSSHRNSWGLSSRNDSKGHTDKQASPLTAAVTRAKELPGPWSLFQSLKFPNIESITAKPTSFPIHWLCPLTALAKTCNINPMKKAHLGRIFLKWRLERKWEEELDYQIKNGAHFQITFIYTDIVIDYRYQS